ncbi:hypothetical protein [Larkinella arboricola]
MSFLKAKIKLQQARESLRRGQITPEQFEKIQAECGLPGLAAHAFSSSLQQLAAASTPPTPAKVNPAKPKTSRGGGKKKTPATPTTPAADQPDDSGNV